MTPSIPPGPTCAHSLTAAPRSGVTSEALAAKLAIGLGKANFCPRALVERGLVKLGNFGRNPNQRQCANILTLGAMTTTGKVG